MATSKRSVLITGCSDGGMGAALAKEFHNAGLHVYATARDTSKMKSVTALGIETLPLDVQSETSIQACAAKISNLDILVNNAAVSYSMPTSDISLPEAKKLFDTNVWGCIAVAQAFLPLLLKSEKAIIANHTSVGAVIALPFQGTYNASKAAMAMFSDTMRLELEPFGITVVNLKTGGVETKIMENNRANHTEVPSNSIYAPAREVVNSALRGDWVEASGAKMAAEEWAKGVVADLLKKNPPPEVWRGTQAMMVGWLSLLPYGWLDGMIKKMTGVDKVEQIIKKR